MRVQQRRLQQAALDEQQAKLDAIEQKKRRNRELTRFNTALLARRQRELDAERALEQQIVQSSTDQHQQAAQNRTKDKVRLLTCRAVEVRATHPLTLTVQMRLREEMEAYREYMRQRREEEKRLEDELEKLTNHELAKVHALRDQQKRKEDEARKRLMTNVHQARNQQLAAKGRSFLAISTRPHCNKIWSQSKKDSVLGSRCWRTDGA